MDFVERKSVQEVVKKEWDGSCGRYEGRQIIYSEKVIRGLELCTLNMKCAKEECPYYPKDDCFQSMHEDALSLMKAQEPKFVSDIAEVMIGCKPKVKVGHCPSCGVLMSETDRYCRKCGQAVKWDE